MKSYTRLLTIAGSDSGGGAGIQADLKAFSACGCYGMSAITAITAQNTLGVTDIHPVPLATLEAQIRAVLDDIGIDAVKIGMLHSAEVMECVADLLAHYECSPVVLDPVMVATSGDPLIEENGIEALKNVLFPHVHLITPNLPEAALLLGEEIAAEDLSRAAKKLSELYAVNVLLKAGHLETDTLEDVLVLTSGETHLYSNPKIITKNSHGTGCTLSSAIASFLGKGLTIPEAVASAETYLHEAILQGAAYELGEGHGPVHHFHNFW